MAVRFRNTLGSIVTLIVHDKRYVVPAYGSIVANNPGAEQALRGYTFLRSEGEVDLSQPSMTPQQASSPPVQRQVEQPQQPAITPPRRTQIEIQNGPGFFVDDESRGNPRAQDVPQEIREQAPPMTTAPPIESYSGVERDLIEQMIWDPGTGAVDFDKIDMRKVKKAEIVFLLDQIGLPYTEKDTYADLKAYLKSIKEEQ